MATRQIRRNDLIGLTSLSFIRPQRLAFSVSGTKPLTRLYAFFDGVSVDAYITTVPVSLTTDAAGSITGTFDIPPATFNTGERTLRLQDSAAFDDSSVPGSTVGSASAIFSASGLKQTFRETITNITEVVNILEQNILDAPPLPAPLNTDRGDGTGDGAGGGADPLAQTFFTYGVKGGMFVTKIDLYFQTKDTAIPVILQLRHVVNGYPGPTLISAWSSVTLPPSAINISSNASAATTFTFSRPIYLEEDKDYCFVILANSNNYNMWTSKFGDVSVETGKTIFEQPFIGSLFKSENNLTWTAEQTEDIKFTLYKASFATGPQTITFKANAQPTLLLGEEFTVTLGSAVVTLKLKFQHGHKTGDKIVLTGITNGNYRGISSAAISNSAGFTVTVVDAYTLTFNAGVNATSLGTLAASGILNSVGVDAQGSGYVAPVIAISAAIGDGGTGATAVAVVVGGKITSVTVTNAGTGYTSTPILTLTDASGSGAVLVPISETIFVSTLNRKFQNAMPIVYADLPPGTKITNTLRSSNEDYVIGEHAEQPINRAVSVNKEAVLVNPATEVTSFGSTATTQMILRIESDNANVSPLIDLNEPPRLRLHNFLVNDKTGPIATAELTPNTGTALSRYISNITTVGTVSSGIRLFVTAASVSSSSFDVFIRTSLSGNTTSHRDGVWTLLNCDVARNLSSTWREYKDYEFYLDSLAPFDVYDIKIVLYSAFKYIFPKIANYRAIILAT